MARVIKTEVPLDCDDFARKDLLLQQYGERLERLSQQNRVVAETMMIRIGESGHPVFRATSTLSRGTLKSKGVGKLSVHFCADGEMVETVFRTIISVNQLSIYGAVSDLCD